MKCPSCEGSVLETFTKTIEKVMNLRKDVCIFCGESPGNMVITENGYCGDKCSKCELIYISPHPTNEEVVNLYEFDKGLASSHLLSYIGRIPKAKYHLGIIKKFISNGSLLEIGVGSGTFLSEAQKQGFEVYGIELNVIQADFVKNQLDIPCEDVPLYASSFGGRQFDIVYHCDVLSHFNNPISEFIKIHSRLKKGGFLIFQTGNIGEIDRKYYKWFSSFQYPHHLYFFSQNSLKLLLKKSGFEYLSSFNFSLLAKLALDKIVMRLLKQRINNGISSSGYSHNSTLFSKIVTTVFYSIDFLLSYKIGSLLPKQGKPQTIIVVAQKV